MPQIRDCFVHPVGVCLSVGSRWDNHSDGLPAECPDTLDHEVIEKLNGAEALLVGSLSPLPGLSLGNELILLTKHPSQVLLKTWHCSFL